MAKRYDWDSSADIGRAAVAAVMEFFPSAAAFRHLFRTHSVTNVEDDPSFQKQEIDLVWSVLIGGVVDRMTIEVKGDRNDKSGNFFLETVSNKARGTKGAFLACEADWFFYYFVHAQVLYCMPTNVTRAWFDANAGRFAERETGSRRDACTWQTLGRLVPIQTLLNEVGCVPSFRKASNGWEFVPLEASSLTSPTSGRPAA